MTTDESLTDRLDRMANRIDVVADLDAVLDAADRNSMVPGTAGPRRAAYLNAVAAVAAVVVAGFVLARLTGGATETGPSITPTGPGSPESEELAIELIWAAYDLRGWRPQAIIWMAPDATDAEVAAVAARLDGSWMVGEVDYVDRAETYEEFTAYFAERPEVVALVDREDLPTSFQVEAIAPGFLAEDLSGLPGVSHVDFAS